MRLFHILTSRLFAVVLLSVSTALLILLNRTPEFYSPLFLIIPAFLTLSIASCLARRIRSAAKKDLGFAGSVVFHIGLILVILSVSAGAFTGFLATVALPEGLTVGLNNVRFATIHPKGLSKEVPLMTLRLDKHDVIYEKDRFPVDYSADVRISLVEEGEHNESYETIRVNSPAYKAGYKFLLQSGALSPRFTISDKNAAIVFDTHVNVSNGTDTEDILKIPDTGLTLHTRFFPDVFNEGGRYGTRSFQPKNPAFGIRVTMDKEPFRDVWRGVLKAGERAEFAGYTLEFADLKQVVMLQVVKDPSYYGIMAGWFLMVLGLTLRYMPIGTLMRKIKSIAEKGAYDEGS